MPFEFFPITLSSGDLPTNHEILRKVSSLCRQLPVLDGTSFQKEFHSVCMLEEIFRKSCFCLLPFVCVYIQMLSGWSEFRAI